MGSNDENPKRQRTRTNSCGVSSSPIDKIFKIIRPNSHLNDLSMPAEVTKQSEDNPYMNDSAIIIALSETPDNDKESLPKEIGSQSFLSETLIPSNDKPNKKDTVLVEAFLLDVERKSRNPSGECSGERSDGDISSASEEEKKTVSLFKNQEKAKKFHKQHNLKHCQKCQTDPTTSPRKRTPSKATQDKLDYEPDSLPQDIVYIDSFVSHVHKR